MTSLKYCHRPAYLRVILKWLQTCAPNTSEYDPTPYRCHNRNQHLRYANDIFCIIQKTRRDISKYIKKRRDISWNKSLRPTLRARLPLRKYWDKNLLYCKFLCFRSLKSFHQCDEHETSWCHSNFVVPFKLYGSIQTWRYHSFMKIWCHPDSVLILDFMVPFRHGAIRILWCHSDIVPSKLHGVIQTLWCHSYFMVPFKLHGVIQTLWCHSNFMVPFVNFMVPFKLHGAIQTSQCHSNFMKPSNFIY